MNEEINVSPNEISPKEFILKVIEWVQYLKTQWLKITILVFLGGFIGFVYAWMQPLKYEAKSIFIVEENKGNGGIAGLASLAGQFGVDFGSSSGSGNILAGDNILYYFKSKALVRELLLLNYTYDNKLTFAEKYVEIYKKSNQWNKNIRLQSSESNTRVRDSLLNSIIDEILAGSYKITRVQKNMGFIEVKVLMADEYFAKAYCDKIIEIAVNRYVETKVKRQKQTVDNLQGRADSIYRLLNNKTSAGAKLQTNSATMDINPIYRSSSAIETETIVRDKTILTTIFAEVTKNLELAKFTLSQETPVLQILDSPIFPLYIDKPSKRKYAMNGAILATFFCVTFFISHKWWKNIF